MCFCRSGDGESKTTGTESVPQGTEEATPIDDGSSAWPYPEEETINKDTFYRTIGRTGIHYGPDFKMVWRVNTADTDAQMRCGLSKAVFMLSIGLSLDKKRAISFLKMGMSISS